MVQNLYRSDNIRLANQIAQFTMVLVLILNKLPVISKMLQLNVTFMSTMAKDRRSYKAGIIDSVKWLLTARSTDDSPRLIHRNQVYTKTYSIDVLCDFKICGIFFLQQILLIDFPLFLGAGL
jgi:hypothetical protein